MIDGSEPVDALFHSVTGRTPHARGITKVGNVWFDAGMNEGMDGLARLIEDTLPLRVVFRSHDPFFYFESALPRVKSAGLPRVEELAMTEGKAMALLSGRGSCLTQE